MQKILGLMRRAVQDYNMIETGDRIAVGVSGGKDSVTTLCALAALRAFYPKPFELVAITLDLGFSGRAGDFSPVEALCEKLGVPYVVKRTNIGHVVFDVRREKNPCALCANLRRGSLNDAAVENGCNKVALGHHLDDVVETFMMNLLHGSRINCFSPVTYLTRRKVTLIRPLIYATEKEIVGTVVKDGLPVVKNPCPANGFTAREKTKNLLRTLDKEYPGITHRVFSALRGSHIDGW
jgi:tRNA 2-thiocytidine biosynthesis protein TtcA